MTLVDHRTELSTLPEGTPPQVLYPRYKPWTYREWVAFLST